MPLLRRVPDLPGVHESRAAEPQLQPRSAAATRLDPSTLFARWFWLVYLPLGLVLAALALSAGGILSPRVGVPLLLGIGAWSALAVRLLIERRRRRLEVPTPRAILAGMALVAGLAVTGTLLTWIGVGQLSSGTGLALMLLGGFLMLLAVFAPAFKLLDAMLRLTGRIIARQRSSAG